MASGPVTAKPATNPREVVRCRALCGGGFILFLVPEEKQDAVRQELTRLKELPISMEPQGSKIIYVSGT